MEISKIVFVVWGCTPWPSQCNDLSNWDGDGMQLGHMWDCNGMKCDAETLRPWDEYRYISSPDYAPQDPAAHGGAAYGERLWLVGRATDAISHMFADGSDEETRCGTDSVGGCGRCLLIQSPDAAKKDWTAVVMKKSSCRPWVPGCAPPIKRFEVAVPGYDVDTTSGSSNVCTNRSGTIFQNKGDSYLMGKWNKEFNNTADPQNLARCESLPDEFVSGCKLFSEWGWSSATPRGVRYKKVKCPDRFTEWVGEKFTSDGVATKGWSGQNLHLRHYWNCAGMSCDQSGMQPFENWRFVASPAYGPQDPEMHGGAEYGEKMWLVGAASNTLSGFLGEDDPCCGKDWNSAGCGKCFLLIQNPDALESNWSAVVMKKSTCHPATKGCGKNEVHLDLAIPGFDDPSEGHAHQNVCGKRAQTMLDGQEQSAVLGTWYENSDSTNASSSIIKCDWLSAAYRPGCRLFASWGWTSHAPEKVKFKRVQCPARFAQWVEAAFSEAGVPVNILVWPTTTTTTTSTTTTRTTTTMLSTTTSTTTSTVVTSSTTTSEVVTAFLGQQNTAESDSGRVLAVMVFGSCIGVVCFVSCLFACCASKCRG